MKSKKKMQNEPGDEPRSNSSTLSRRMLADRWACSTETLKRRERGGTLPFLRLGGLVRYRLNDIEKIEEEAKG